MRKGSVMNDISRIAGHAPFVAEGASSAPPDYAQYRVVPARNPARTLGTAAAIVEALSGRAPQPIMMTSTCYSYVDDRQAMHVASVHRYDSNTKTMEPVAGAGGLSAEANRQEGVLADAWAQAIWKDMLS